MRKVSTLFQRDHQVDKRLVIDLVTPGCEWVLAGEGKPYRKLDGTCCMVFGGGLFKRREVRPERPTPAAFSFVHVDPVTGKIIGWVPVSDGPEDKYHREALESFKLRGSIPDFKDEFTCELIGPKVQGNPEDVPDHRLVPHKSHVLELVDVPLTFEGLRAYLTARDIEGVVWHHEDGRMAKIKQRDFGLQRVHYCQ